MFTYLLHVISDVFFVIFTIKLIDTFGISKLKGKNYFFIILITTSVLSILSFVSYLHDLDLIPLLLYPLMFILSYLIVFKEIKLAQIYIYLFSELITSLLSSCLTSVILSFTPLQTDVKNILSLFCVRLLYSSIIFIFIFKRKEQAKHIYSITQTIPKYVFILILFSNLLITFLAEVNNHHSRSVAKQNTITILIMLLSIFLIVIIFSLLINVASKNYYTTLNSLLEKQVEAQIAHYEKLEELNSDIRQLRHDYINHLTSVGTLIEHKNYSDALQYIERLTESTHCNETIYSTGNHLADAILTGKSSECKGFADIEFNGIITDRINNIDMCAILANALDNAIEACRKCSGRSKISIAAQNKQGYWL